MISFNPDKPVETRDGRKARIICKDRSGKFPIVALVDLPDSWQSEHGVAHETVRCYKEDGTGVGGLSDNLVNVAESHTAWYLFARGPTGRVTMTGSGAGYSSEKQAKEAWDMNGIRTHGYTLFSIKKLKVSDGGS